MKALGVDVSQTRGLDLVLLEDGHTRPLHIASRVSVEGLRKMLGLWRPDIVAIDSPDRWAHVGGSRICEERLRGFGIQCYGTPSSEARKGQPFYGWMHKGMEVFGASADCGYGAYDGGRFERRAIEVFPHASAVVLAGALSAARVPKRKWRAAILRSCGVDTAMLRTTDQIDAALAALTGLRALRGEASAVGEARDGYIVLPSKELPSVPYRRAKEGAAAGSEVQAHLPGMRPCACGEATCREMTRREFAPGHDGKRKALLWKRARLGDEALSELRRRGWGVPPELD